MKVWVLLHTRGYSHDDVEVVAVYTSKEAADEAHDNHPEPGNCLVEESTLIENEAPTMDNETKWDNVRDGLDIGVILEAATVLDDGYNVSLVRDLRDLHAILTRATPRPRRNGTL